MYVFNIIFGNLHAEKKSSSKIKLLLNKFELKKIQSETNQVGSTLIPTKIFTNDNGIAKIEISIAKGKKLYDKRNTIKERENKINLKGSLSLKFYLLALEQIKSYPSQFFLFYF